MSDQKNKWATIEIYVHKDKKYIKRFLEASKDFLKVYLTSYSQNPQLIEESIIKELKKIESLKVSWKSAKTNFEYIHPAHTIFSPYYNTLYDWSLSFNKAGNFWVIRLRDDYWYNNKHNKKELGMIKKETLKFIQKIINNVKPFEINMGWSSCINLQDSFLWQDTEIEVRGRKTTYLQIYRNDEPRCQELEFNDINYFSSELLKIKDNHVFLRSVKGVHKIQMEDGVLTIDKNGSFKELI